MRVETGNVFLDKKKTFQNDLYLCFFVKKTFLLDDLAMFSQCGLLKKMREVSVGLRGRV